MLTAASSPTLAAIVTDTPELEVGQVHIVELGDGQEGHRDGTRTEAPPRRQKEKKKGQNGFENTLGLPLQNCLLPFYFFKMIKSA
jgi:hypothetical protein